MKPYTVLITGASSGLGYQLALNYASSDVVLILIGRNIERLSELENLCIAKGSRVIVQNLDVTDKSQMSSYLSKITNLHNIDILIACAGVSAGTLDGPERASQVETIFNTNVNGVLNTIMPVIPSMIAKRRGSIVIISSMAGLMGLSSAPSYSASKACVRVFGEALRGYLKQYKINVNIVIPGYIKTPMTEVNKFPMPFMISAEKAAKKIINGINKNKGIIAFPIVIYLLLKCLNLLPNPIITYVNSKLPGKPSFED